MVYLEVDDDLEAGKGGDDIALDRNAKDKERIKECNGDLDIEAVDRSGDGSPSLIVQEIHSFSSAHLRWLLGWVCEESSEPCW